MLKIPSSAARHQLQISHLMLLMLLSAAPLVAYSQTTQPSDMANNQALAAVSVSASSSATVTQQPQVQAGALGDRTALDTPYSIATADSAQIADLQARTALDAFKYDPSVTTVADGRTFESSQLSVRGLPIDPENGTKVDGQFFPGWASDLPMEAFENVQLLKGLGGFMYGFGSPGGIVNYVLKRPTDKRFTSVTVGYESDGVFAEKIDTGGRVGPTGQIGYRFNLVNEDGRTSEDDGHVRRKAVSAAFDFRITPQLTLSVDGLYQKKKSTGTIFGILVANGVGVPDAGAVSRHYAQPQNFYQTEEASVGAGVDYRINDAWKASLKFRYGKENRSNSDSVLDIVSNNGDYSNTLYTSLTRFFDQTVDGMVQGSFKTGPLEHHVVIGAGYQSQMLEFDHEAGWSPGYDLGTGNIYAHSVLTNSAVTLSPALYKYNRIAQASVYASDTVDITSRLSLLAGVRYEQYKEYTWNVDGSTASTYSVNPVTPTFAAIYKLTPHATAYFSYMESLEAGGSASVTNANYPTTYGPLRSRQYEVGVKLDKPRYGGAIALFRLDQGYEYTNNSNVYVQDGKKRYLGLDASGWADLYDNWKVTGGVVLLNAKSIDIQDPTVEGKRPWGAPHVVATAHVEYTPPVLDGLTLSAGVKYTGNMAVDATNAHMVPSYTTVDIGAKYETSIARRDVTFRIGIDNLANRRYWTTGYGEYLFPGATRTFLATSTINF